MASVTLKETGLKEAIRAVGMIGERTERFVINKATLHGAKFMQRAIRSFVPVTMDKLRKSISQRKLRGKGTSTRYIGPSWPDGALINFVEFGTGARRDPAGNAAGSKAIGRAYEIKAFDYALKIQGKNTSPAALLGRFFPKVLNPGIRPRPIMRPAFLLQGQRMLDETMRAATKFAHEELDKLGQETIPPGAKKRAGF